MRFSSCLIGLFFTASVGLAADWQPLFNGKNLAGWRANNDPESFSVVDGQIKVQASSRRAAHLFYVGEQSKTVERFRDFELELTARAAPNSNSGVFVHTDTSVRNKAMHLAKGYEVQLNSTAKEKRKTGSLYAVVDLDRSPVDETEWFEVRIVVRGKRITIELNGKEVVDYTEPPDVKRPPERAGRVFSDKGGAIALQAHDPNSVWYFKDIRIKPLP